MKNHEYTNNHINDKSNISILLPTFYSNKKVWIGLESILNFNDENIFWDLVICDDNGDTFNVIEKYIIKLLRKNCCKIKYININSKEDGIYKDKYTLLEKWKLMSQNAMSPISILQADDDYSSRNRLLIHLEHFANEKCYFSTQPIGVFYNINNYKIFIYDGYKRKRYNTVKMMHVNMAHLTKYLSNITITELYSGVDQYILKDIYNQINEEKKTIINLDKTIFYDNSDDWKYGFFSDGLNTISKREHLYIKTEEKTNNIITYFKESKNNRQYIENNTILDAIKMVCRTCWCLSESKLLYEYYNYYNITNYINILLLKLLTLQYYLLVNNLYKKEELSNNFINLLPICNIDIDIHKLKYIHLFSQLNKVDVIIDPLQYLISINITELDILDKKIILPYIINNDFKIYQKILINNFYCTKMVYVSDCHEYTFKNGYDGLINLLKIYNIQYMCMRIKYSKEYYLMKKLLYPYCKVIAVPWVLKLNQFKDLSSKKEYDILFYGSDYPKSYPFRNRLKILLQTQKFQTNFKIRIIEWKEGFKGNNLFNEVSKSYLTVSTKSSFNYLVKKYFEIPLSNSFIIGDMADYGYDYFDNNDFINIENHMTDDNIFKIIQNALLDKNILLDKIEKTKNKVYKIQSNNIHDLSNLEIQDVIITINNYKFTKDVLYIKQFLDTNINFILSYKTILIKNKIDLNIFKNYDISNKFIYILKYESKIKTIDTNETIVFDFKNEFIKNMSVICIDNDIISYYK